MSCPAYIIQRGTAKIQGRRGGGGGGGGNTLVLNKALQSPRYSGSRILPLKILTKVLRSSSKNGLSPSFGHLFQTRFSS